MQQITLTALTVALYMIKDVPLRQDVPVVSGRGPLMTRPNGDLQMPCAAVNLVAAHLVPSPLLLISPMEAPAALLHSRTVQMTPGALAATGLGPL
jgi:hypothetical protein